ncbi:hypothetical protein Tco_0791965 [Tanacetum coccineum]
MFQPWRALTTIINLCLTGKTSGFERPRALVLQILWGVINRAHIDYAERMWEECTQSIHTFTKDKKNLAQHTQGKKKATLIVIPSVRFTKLIIFHLQRKHKFYPRPESPLHLPTEEPILGYLKFSAKGTKREVFGMPIPNELITDDIRGADYYNAYLKKVAKHQRYLAGEEVSDPDSPAPKPAKSTKPKITKQAKPVAPKASTSNLNQAPTKTKEKETTKPGIQDEGQAGPNLVTTTGQMGACQLYRDVVFSTTLSQRRPALAINSSMNKTKKANNEKATADTKAESMVSVTIHQDTSVIPPMTSPVIVLVSVPDSPTVHRAFTNHHVCPQLQPTTTTMYGQPFSTTSATITLEERLDKHGSRLYRLENQDIPNQVSKAVDEIVTDAVDWAIQAPLRERFRDLPEADMKEILHNRM